MRFDLFLKKQHSSANHPPALARNIPHHTNIPNQLFQRFFSKNLAAAARNIPHHTNIPNRLFQRSFTKNLTAHQSLRKNLKKLLRERKKCVIIPSEEYLNAKMRSAVRQSAFRREGHHRLGVTRTQSCMHFPAEQTRSKTASSRVRSATVIQPRVRAPLGRARIKVVTRRILLLRPFSGWGAFLFRSSPPAASAGPHSGKPFGRARPMN